MTPPRARRLSNATLPLNVMETKEAGFSAASIGTRGIDD